MAGREIMLSIGDVSRFLGIPTHTLRYWEKEFSDYLSPERTHGKQRRYSDSDINTIKEIKKLLKEDGYSLAGAKKILSMKNPEEKNGDTPSPYDIADSIARMIKEKLTVKESKEITAA